MYETDVHRRTTSFGSASRLILLTKVKGIVQVNEEQLLSRTSKSANNFPTGTGDTTLGRKLIRVCVSKI